ncbi:MAG: cysteine desulfurase family protein [Gemmatimonadales bacterium]|jgi:cysteine desulfurase
MPTPIYLDHAATTPVRREVRDAMLPFLGEEAFGNPSSAHRFGRQVRSAVEAARERVAAAVGAEPREVVFTSGGTEADNLAVLGLAAAAAPGGDWSGLHLVSSPTEHKAVLAALHEAERRGACVTLLPVDRGGLVELAALDAALAGKLPGGKPALVSVMWINNEVGTLQPVGAIAERCRAAGVPFHSDGVQALGKVAIDLREALCDALAISAHKIGGPKGTGALIVRGGRRPRPLIHGGSQQGGVRPGTENVAGIVGFGAAAELAAAEQPVKALSLAMMRDALEAMLRAAVPDAVVHGAGAPRGPAILNISAPGTDSEAMLMHLDLAGVAAASGSACTTGSIEPSHVLEAMGVPRELAVAAVRFSVGALSKPEHAALVTERYAKAVEKVRGLRAALGAQRDLRDLR